MRVPEIRTWIALLSLTWLSGVHGTSCSTTVANAYSSKLCRSPTNAELTFYTSRCDGGMSQSAIEAALIGTPEWQYCDTCKAQCGSVCNTPAPSTPLLDCQSNGDPHFKTVSGGRFDYMDLTTHLLTSATNVCGAGERTTPVTAHVYHCPFNRAAVNVGVAVRIGYHTISILKNILNVNGTVASTNMLTTLAADGISVSSPNNYDTGSPHVVISHSSGLTVRSLGYTNGNSVAGYYQDLRLRIPRHPLSLPPHLSGFTQRWLADSVTWCRGVQGHQGLCTERGSGWGVDPLGSLFTTAQIDTLNSACGMQTIASHYAGECGWVVSFYPRHVPPPSSHPSSHPRLQPRLHPQHSPSTLLVCVRVGSPHNAWGP